MSNLTNPSFGEAALIALLGIGFVFLVLAFLMVILMISAAIFKAIEKRKQAKAAPAPAEAPAVPAPEKPLAKGSCGDLKLHDVPPRDAAMVMAIVADELKTPLNELRFTSIKKAESEEAK